MSYLDNLGDHKRENKMDESDVLSMLNDNLRDTVLVYLNGRLL